MTTNYLNKFDPLQITYSSVSSEKAYFQVDDKKLDSQFPKETIWYPHNGSLHEQLGKDTDQTDSIIEDSEYIDTYYKRKRLAPVVHLKRVPVISTRFISLQKWECVVLQVLDDSFIARLIDLTNESPDEEAEFALDEVHREDQLLIAEGAVFYWSIGYLETGGQRRRVSDIRFRRLPK